MHVHVAMPGHELLDPRGLVAAEVVADDVDFALLGLAGDDVAEEGHELFAGVKLRSLAQDLAGGRVQRREQAQRPVGPGE